MKILSALRAGRFTVNPDLAEGTAAWESLAEQADMEERGCVRHVRLQGPVTALMNGHQSLGILLKPEGTPSTVH